MGHQRREPPPVPVDDAPMVGHDAHFDYVHATKQFARCRSTRRWWELMKPAMGRGAEWHHVQHWLARDLLDTMVLVPRKPENFIEYAEATSA